MANYSHFRVKKINFFVLMCLVAALDAGEISAVEERTSEATVCSEAPGSLADDDNVWAKPLPVTKEKSRSALHFLSPLCT